GACGRRKVETVRVSDVEIQTWDMRAHKLRARRGPPGLVGQVCLYGRYLTRLNYHDDYVEVLSAYSRRTTQEPRTKEPRTKSRARSKRGMPPAQTKEPRTKEPRTKCASRVRSKRGMPPAYFVRGSRAWCAALALGAWLARLVRGSCAWYAAL